MGSNDRPVPFTCEISARNWKGPLFPRNAKPSPGKKVFISAGIWSLPENALQLVGGSCGTFIKHLNTHRDGASPFQGSFAYPCWVAGKEKEGFTTEPIGFERRLAPGTQVSLFSPLSEACPAPVCFHVGKPGCLMSILKIISDILVLEIKEKLQWMHSRSDRRRLLRQIKCHF